jgi:hypothetical protein
MNRLWTELRPTLRSKASRQAFAAYVSVLARLRKDDDFEEKVDDARNSFVETVRSKGYADRQFLMAAGLVLADLAVQGWRLRARRGLVKVRPPVEVSDRAAEKTRIRRQELIKRDAQLRRAAAQKFVRTMEQPHVVNGRFTSIFSLMRDGRELANALRAARACTRDDSTEAIARVVDPYLQFVVSDQATCLFTGLRLMDIWRYFRHTWTNQYTSTPGRSMMFLVRDRAADLHPIVGIGALSSPVMQIRERDAWVGWHPDVFLAQVRTQPTSELAQWLVSTVDAAITEIYIDDFVEDGFMSPRSLTSPNDTLICRLLQEAAEQRRLHHRFVRSRDHKERRCALEAGHWVERARTHLFRSKRALALATYLRARAILKDAFGAAPTAHKLSALASTGQGSDAIRKIVKKAKADRIGISVADLTVCGAIQPYNSILGGKLVAMLAASPEIVLEYRRRYASAESEIASAIAGRPIVREPALALLGTTSLYGVGSSQYNRIRIPCDRIGGRPDELIQYAELGHSEAFGTSQYSEETVAALADVVQQSANGQRVNSIFGEGISPKLRKVREGLSVLGLPTDLLLRHHRRRVVYAVSLVRNLREHLLGNDPEPGYLLPLENAASGTGCIAAWWRDRWLRSRIASDDVLAEIARHTLVRPISHGARVVLPPVPDREMVFVDDTEQMSSSAVGGV